MKNTNAEKISKTEFSLHESIRNKTVRIIVQIPLFTKSDLIFD
jgi:hypothetical protein